MKVCRYWCHGRAGSTLLSLSLFIVNSRFQCTANIMLIPWTNSTHFILNQLLVKHLGTQIKAIEAVLQSPFHLFTLNRKKGKQIKFYSIFRVFVWNTISASPKFIRESFWELHFRATASTSWADPSALNCHFLAAQGFSLSAASPLRPKRGVMFCSRSYSSEHGFYQVFTFINALHLA